MIKVEECKMENEDVWFVRVTHTKPHLEDIRVFFDGDSNCLWTYLLSLGLNDSGIETQLDSFVNIKL